MPTFTAIALDRLIESGASKSMTIRKNVHDSKSGRINNTTNSKLERGMNNSSKPPLERRNSTSTTTTVNNKHHWPQITPALYATPESTPLPDSPSSFPPSPYVINHKRRGPRLLKSYSEDDVTAHKRAIEEEKVDDNAKFTENEATDSAKDATSTVSIPSPGEEEHVNGTCNGEHGVNHLANGLASQNGSAVQNRIMKSVASSCEEGGELEDFLDPQDSISAKSNTEGESNSGVERSLYLNQPVAEFYDACDELSFESGPQPSPRDVEAELREIRLTLLMEIEKRKQAEETLDDMRTKWLTIRQQLSLVGLTLPADPIASDEDEEGADPAEELCRQVYLARFVSNSIGRGTAKAEVEMEMEAQVESKNFEIARLWDRLHYYEAVNREMSQRNQEAVGYVAVLGKPNVGKSTLSNQMIGQKLSIVTDKPQTTRHRILGLCSGQMYQMILYDTPGVIEKKMHKLDSMMMKNVRDAAINADCALVVVDACKAPQKIDDILEEGVGNHNDRIPLLLVLNKTDLIKPGEIAKKLEWYEKFTDVDEVIPVSAKYGQGVDDVKDWILSKLPFGPAYYPKDIASEHPERFFVAEIVREKIFMQYRNEVPYACQVNVVTYKSRPAAKDFIQVEIVVEKNTQKIILIGKEGKALKQLATAARLDIEDFLQKKVFLEIEVKIKENWRQDEGLLKHYGYGGQIRVV